MGEQLPRFRPGQAIPVLGDEVQLLAGRFASLPTGKSAQGDYLVELCGAGDRALGVIEQDSADPSDTVNQSPTSAELRVNCGRNGIARVEASEPITAGAEITSDGDGKAAIVGGGDKVNGYACSDADTGEFVEVAQV